MKREREREATTDELLAQRSPSAVKYSDGSTHKEEENGGLLYHGRKCIRYFGSERLHLAGYS